MKTYRFISLTAVCLLSVAVSFSCAKQDVPSIEEEEPGVSVLFAELEPQTKVVLGDWEDGRGYPLEWEEYDDDITVWNKNGAPCGHYWIDSLSAPTCARFVKFLGSEVQAGPVYAFYPYDNTYPSSSIVDFSIKREQNYRAGSFGTSLYYGGERGAMPMAASSDTTTRIRFSPVMSVLKIQLKDTRSEPVSVSKIVLRNRDRNLSAQDKSVQIDLTDYLVDAPALTWTREDNSSNYVTLNCDPAVQLGSDTTSFHIVVPAGNYSDFTVMIYTADGKLMKKSLKAKDGAIKFRRNYVKSMPVLQFEEFDYHSIDYIEGNADGDTTNYGPGVKIGELFWAPVNCGIGYESEYPNGLLYQWGRRYGQDPDSTGGRSPLSEGKVKSLRFDQGQNAGEAGFHGRFNLVEGTEYVWYSDAEILGDIKDSLWNTNVRCPYKTPYKGDYDPCPEGWRIPTKEEAEALTTENGFVWTNIDNHGISYSDGERTLKLYPCNYHKEDGSNTEYGKYRLHVWTSDYSRGATNKVHTLVFRQGAVDIQDANNAAIAYSVRCVYDGLNQ